MDRQSLAKRLYFIQFESEVSEKNAQNPRIALINYHYLDIRYNFLAVNSVYSKVTYITT
ncbi:MAG: hypothetical protein ACI8ZM_000999 [Crocinitomix sp.]|jgi:hypothetical protein